MTAKIRFRFWWIQTKLANGCGTFIWNSLWKVFSSTLSFLLWFRFFCATFFMDILKRNIYIIHWKMCKFKLIIDYWLDYIQNNCLYVCICICFCTYIYIYWSILMEFTVCHGINQIRMVICLRLASIFMFVVLIWSQMDHSFSYSCRSVCIIMHFIKCFDLRPENWITTISIEMTPNICAKWFVSIFPLKSEYISYFFRLLISWCPYFCYWLHSQKYKKFVQFLDFTTRSWFLRTAKVYSPFILVQLLASMLILASNVFGFDLVTIGNNCSVRSFTVIFRRKFIISN